MTGDAFDKARLSTSVPGLDEILRGGLLRGSTYIINGRPGSGKTTIASQICFGHARQGGRALYATLLSEPHARMLQHLSCFAFYDESYIPDRIYYVSAIKALEEGGLEGLTRLLGDEVRRLRADLLVLDGLANVREAARGSPLDLKRFLQTLEAQTSFAGCTVLMLSSAPLEDGSPEHTMVDGVIELRDEVVSVRSIRRLLVRKFRGSPTLRGLHLFEINNDGCEIFPRMETYPLNEEGPLRTERLPSGVAGLDRVAGGGLGAGSTTLVLGPSGSGKTLLGLHFLTATNAPTLHFGFYETTGRLLQKAASCGIPLAAKLENGTLGILWQQAEEGLIDALGHRLLEAVEAGGFQRVFIDDLGGFARSAIEPERLSHFLAALNRQLQVRGITTMMAWETAGALMPPGHAPTPHISHLVENLILLRHAEVEGQLARSLTVLKMRDSSFEPSLQPFTISEQGLSVGRSGSGGG